MEEQVNKRIFADITNVFGASGARPRESTMLAGAGLRNPSYLPADVLSDNAVDIESWLRGTRATDLTDLQRAHFHPQLRGGALQTLHIYNAAAAAAGMMPSPLVVENYQRPQLLGGKSSYYS